MEIAYEFCTQIANAPANRVDGASLFVSMATPSAEVNGSTSA